VRLRARAPAGFTLEELLLPNVSLALPKRKGLSILFHHLDRVFKVWEKRGSERIRASAIREAEHWILERTRHTEGLGAIYPAMMADAFEVMAEVNRLLGA
jgi:squalene-hopene/tetraprenyl-beta-curcumene cyclase